MVFFFIIPDRRTGDENSISRSSKPPFFPSGISSPNPFYREMKEGKGKPATTSLFRLGRMRLRGKKVCFLMYIEKLAHDNINKKTFRNFLEDY